MAFKDYGVVVGVFLAILGAVLLFQPTLLTPDVPQGAGLVGLILLAVGIGLIAQYGK